MYLSEIMKEVDGLVKKNNWDKPDSHKPQTAKNLAISIMLESAELLEYFQWTENCDSKGVQDEMADILIYISQLANVLNIDLDEAVKNKIDFNKTRTWK